MIIDCHGHYTTAPPAHTSWRDSQRAAFAANEPPPPYPTISDDEIRESVDASQLRLMAERGIDLTVFSPRASAMGHHIGDESVSTRWAQVSNDLIARVVQLYPAALRGDGRARRAGDGPRLSRDQQELPRHRVPLPQRRHHRLHAAAAG